MLLHYLIKHQALKISLMDVQARMQ